MSGLLLDDPSLYLAEIDRLAARRDRDRWFPLDVLRARDIASHASEVASRLAREVPLHGYQFAPLVPRQALINHKQRTLYQIDALDAVVWSAAARAISAAIDDRLGDHLYSYRPGRSQWRAADALLAFMRQHVADRPDPRTRGLYVMRRDVRQYGESISNDDQSSLWAALHGLLAGRSVGIRGDAQGFLKALLRPVIRHADGSTCPLTVGVPNGIPTQVIACNVYMLPADRAALRIEGGFYARFGDDILYAHADYEHFTSAVSVLDAAVAALGLSFNPTKSRDLWLTAPGRADARRTECQPVRELAYLGLDVGFSGVRLRSDKRRQFWLELRQRLSTTSLMLADLSFEERASALCAVVVAMLNPADPVAQRYASWLRTRAMDRGDLRALDHSIARQIAFLLTGLRGVKAFRQAPPRLLRTKYGLPSLIANLDAARRHGRPS